MLYRLFGKFGGSSSIKRIFEAYIINIIVIMIKSIKMQNLVLNWKYFKAENFFFFCDIVLNKKIILEYYLNILLLI